MDRRAHDVASFKARHINVDLSATTRVDACRGNMAQQYGFNVEGAVGEENAIALLRQQHRQIQQQFARYEQEVSESQWGVAVKDALAALKMHMEVEEEVFYPAYLDATDDQEGHHDAMVEHEAAKKLIEDIEYSDPADEYFEAMMRVLFKIVRAHIVEEEAPGGMFDSARRTGVDLRKLARNMAAKQAELEETAELRYSRRRSAEFNSLLQRR
jgi:hypothetical protein